MLAWDGGSIEHAGLWEGQDLVRKLEVLLSAIVLGGKVVILIIFKPTVPDLRAPDRAVLIVRPAEIVGGRDLGAVGCLVLQSHFPKDDHGRGNPKDET